MQTGSDADEEEVDIGDDMPAKEFPPIVIEKETGANAKNSNYSISSSGSGSSSSGNSRLKLLLPQWQLSFPKNFHFSLDYGDIKMWLI